MSVSNAFSTKNNNKIPEFTKMFLLCATAIAAIIVIYSFIYMQCLQSFSPPYTSNVFY